MAKSGADHIASLKDGREIYLDGRRVDDVTTHPAYRNSVRSIAALYDMQCDPALAELLTYESPATGERVNRCWQLPRDYGELVQRRHALVAWLKPHFGFMGRSPDHTASGICGMRIGLDVFEAHHPDRARALRDYYEFARDNDVFQTYAIINPQGDRSRAVSDQDDAYHATAIVDEDAEGITVRGGKMLGTSAIMANEILLANIQPLRPDEERYAIAAAVPVNARGLKIFSRKSYEQHAVSAFDNPLSARFDENDAVFYFDDVKIPWERVFVHRDTRMCRDMFTEAPTHTCHNYQCQARIFVKLRFLLGIARKIAETNGTIGIPSVRETLGKLAAQAAMVEGMLYGIEAGGEMRGAYFVPSRHLLYAALCMTQTLYKDFVHDVRELAGGGLIMLPSSVEDFANPDISPYIHKTQKSPATDPEGRVKFFKLAWDALGSEFASRHAQYEMFYVGASFVTRGHMFRTYPWDDALTMIEDFMASYDASSVLAARGRERAA